MTGKGAGSSTGTRLEVPPKILAKLSVSFAVVCVES